MRGVFRGSHRNIIFIIIFCQFISAISALGMPPFFALILKESFGSGGATHTSIAGLLYVLPTFFGALSSPYWGKLADRYGKKKLLIRAQLGLAISFLLAGFSTTPYGFYFALILQGIFGGTFAASRAYLSNFVKGDDLAKSLTALETAPRAALVISPFLMGIMIHSQSPVLIYRYLAVLPVICSLLTAALPEYKLSLVSPTRSSPDSLVTSNLDGMKRLVLWSQFFFGTSSVAATPFFTLYTQNQFSHLTPAQVGILFGIPHTVYLFFSRPINNVINSFSSTDTLLMAFLIQGLSYMGQATAQSVTALVIWRLVMGVSMTLTLITIHKLISKTVHSSQSGHWFGKIESSARLSTVLGGLLASISFKYLGTKTPLFVSAWLLICSAFIIQTLFKPHVEEYPLWK